MMIYSWFSYQRWSCSSSQTSQTLSLPEDNQLATEKWWDSTRFCAMLLPCYSNPMLFESKSKAMDDINVKSLAEHDLMVLCKAYCDTAAWMIPLVNVYIYNYGKIHPFFYMGKQPTISTGPFSIATLNYQRVDDHWMIIGWLECGRKSLRFCG